MPTKGGKRLPIDDVNVQAQAAANQVKASEELSQEDQNDMLGYIHRAVQVRIIDNTLKAIRKETVKQMTGGPKVGGHPGLEGEYAPIEGAVFSMFERMRGDAETFILHVKDVMAEFQPEIPSKKKGAFTDTEVRDTLIEALMNEGLCLQDATDKATAYIVSAKEKRPMTVERAKLKIYDMDPEELDRYLGAGLAGPQEEAAQQSINEGSTWDTMVQWFSKFKSWIGKIKSSIFKLERAQSKTSQLLRKVQHENLSYETDMYLREQFDIKSW